MHFRKRYGESRMDSCPFCGKPATSKNPQGVPACIAHRKLMLDGLRCACGSFLEVMAGKWGAYCRCPKCGNVNFKRAVEMNPQLLKQPATEQPKVPEKKKEIVIRSDELHLYY